MDWDLKSYFTEFGNPTYEAFKADLTDSFDSLGSTVEDLLIEPEKKLGQWETFLIEYEHVLSNYSHLASYISCLTAAEAQNDDYLKEQNNLANMEAQASKLGDKVMRGIGSMDDDTFAELCSHERLDNAEFRLEEMREEAKRRMSDKLEALAADLGVDGLSAWSRLYFNTMGSLKFQYTDPERGESEVPMAQLNSLMSDGNRDRRIAASAGVSATFSEHQQMYAGAINAISGTRHTLNKRRGVDSFLDPSIRQSRIKQTTLNALMEAVENRLPFAREVFRFRNECLGIENPGYVDLRAPLPISDNGGPTWKEGVNLISESFNEVYPALGSFFDELIAKKWVDHTPRTGKRPGGFCTGSLATRESRIFMTYKNTLNDVLTLAHEAGHAWHSRVLKDSRVFAGGYPMTLAETASTFAERILTEGVLGNTRLEKSLKLIILDAEVEHMLAFLLDIPVRFRFEEALYERRKSGSLSSTELCELMRETQQKMFGDTLSVGGEDPWFWAAKLHFYISGVQFYNYPYTFGYLLSTGFMQQLREEGSGVLNTYEQFLEQSGRMSCEEVVRATHGGDIEDPNFWAEMIDNLAHPFAEYKKLLQEIYA